MIVILNLVFFFCVSYVARRKCGKRISRLMPKRKKPTALPTPNGKTIQNGPEILLLAVTNLKIDEPAWQSHINSVFDCHLSPHLSIVVMF